MYIFCGDKMDIFSDVKKQQSDEFLKALASLTEDERENFEERAGIMEFHGGLKREEAEKRALEIMFTSFSSLLRKPPEEVRLIVHHSVVYQGENFEALFSLDNFSKTC